MKKNVILFAAVFLTLILITIPSLAQENREISIETNGSFVYVTKTLKLTGLTKKISHTAPEKTTLIWSSSDVSIAKVNTQGIITGVKPGIVTITCSAKDDPSIKATIDIEVRQPVKTFKLGNTNIILLIGAGQEQSQFQIVYAISPEDAYDQTIVWTTSDNQIASVDENGLITASGVGTATISGKTNDPSLPKAQSIKVMVAEAVSSLTLSHKSEVLYVGSTLKMKSDILPLTAGNKKVVWSSSDSSIAKVDSNGIITAIKPGNVTITCSAADGSGVSAACEIGVIRRLKSITLSEKNATLLLGFDDSSASISLDHTITPADAHYQEVLWSSSDETVAIVDQNGFVQAVSAGKATITATSIDPEVKISSTCLVSVGEAVKKITVSPQSTTVAKGKTLKLTAQVFPENAYNKKVAWKSSNDQVAAVSATGQVTAKKVGNATITCTALDGSESTSEIKITVIQAVTSINSTTKRVVLFENKTARVSVKIAPDDATNKTLKWSSSNPYNATVDKNGVITAKRSGETQITAEATDGSNKKYSFKVLIEPLNPIDLESIGFGKYLPNLLGLTVHNRTKTITFTDFDFKMDLYSYTGSKIDSGSYSLGKPVTMGPNSTKTIKRTVFGVGMATKVVITITGVMLKDGTFYSIPLTAQETWTFQR